MTLEVLIAKISGSCAVCSIEIRAGDRMVFPFPADKRRTHPWCAPKLEPLTPPTPPMLSGDDMEEIVGRVEENISESLALHYPSLDPEEIATMVALRLAKPADTFSFGRGEVLGAMTCSQCRFSWPISDHATFECPNGCPPLGDDVSRGGR